MTTTPPPDAGQPESHDIVRTLRDFCEMGLEGGDADPLIEVMHSVASQAADEIERLRAPLAPPREVTKAMVELEPEDPDERRMFDQTVEAFGGRLQRVAHMLWAFSRTLPKEGSFSKSLAICANEVRKAAALNAPARTASDLNIERQVAGLDDIDRDDAAKWRAVSEECEKAGCCLLNAPARVDGNITHAHCHICGRSGQISCERPDCPTKELVAKAPARVDENALTETLGNIARMRILPDDMVNRFTLLAAIEIAERAVAAARERAMVDVTKAPESEHPIFRRLRWEFKIALEYSEPGHTGWRKHEAQLELIESLLREFGQRGELAARERGDG